MGLPVNTWGESEESLKALIDAASRCNCDFDCYCSKNLEYAEYQLEQLRKQKGLYHGLQRN